MIDVSCQKDEKTGQRVMELRQTMNGPLPWVSLCAPKFYSSMRKLPVATGPSCLDCSFVRLSLAVVFAKRHGSGTIAAGFTKYQESWVEQSPVAIQGIAAFLAEYDLCLSLPVHDISRREDAQSILSEAGLNPESMEPRCHCSDTGTKENADPASIRADIALLTDRCRTFIDGCLQEMIE